MLPAAERRRVGAQVKLALGVAQECFESAGQDPRTTAMVFSASSGDTETVHAIFTALALPEREISPTRFHNSVHNAAGGYWSIAAGSHAPSTSVCCYDASFAAGLLDAASQATADGVAVAVVSCDVPYPQPLQGVRPLDDSFGVALALAPKRTSRAIAALAITLVPSSAAETPMQDPGLERLRLGAPAARALPLLAALARGDAATVLFEYVAGNAVQVTISECRKL